MKKLIAVGLVGLMVLLVFAGTSLAMDQNARVSQVMLKGSLNQDNQFVDENGQAYDLVINETTAALLNMPKQKIEIKGTLMEHDGRKQLSITDISPAQE